MCAVAGAVQGSVMLAGAGVFVEQPDRSRRVDGLKYHVGAVNVVPGALGVVRTRTSSAWYPCRSCIQMISVGVSGCIMMLSRMQNLIGMVLMS